MGIKIALAGNPNCGKTTLFNALTGSNQFVGNWPGVTVEKKEGKLKKNNDVVLVDLPGIYSLSPYTLEEVVARNYLIEERPDAILNIIDGTNLERNLYLTTQLIELGIPVVVAINMIDIVRKNGDKINIDKLSKELGCEVVEISALKNIGIAEAANTAVHITKNKAKIIPQHNFGGAVEHALAHIEELILHDMSAEQQRWYAIKLFERDEKISEKLKLDESSIAHIEKDIISCEEELDDDSESIITGERYNYISSIIEGCYKKKNKGSFSTSDKIDRIVTNRWLGLPIFAMVMIIVYYVSVSTVGAWATDWSNDGLFGDGWFLGKGDVEYKRAVEEYDIAQIKLESFEKTAKEKGIEPEDAKNLVTEARVYGEDGETEEVLSVNYKDYNNALKIEEAVPKDYGLWISGIPVLVEKGLDKINCADWLKSLIIDGMIAGVGAVIGFVPQMLVLFLFLAFLEACGYMARIAFIMDRIFRKFGLSGKSFIPMLIGTGCGVPGIMASRTIENDRDRKMTIITTTFIPCGAKLPIIALIAGALFNGAWWVAPSAYFIGILAIITSGVLLKKTKMFSGDPAPFVMELPSYHMPTMANVLRSMWERSFSFIKKAGTIILLATVIVWFASNFGFSEGRFGMVDTEESMLAMIGGSIAWIFIPLGWGTWRATVATITGLIAKENVVGTFGVLYAMNEVSESGWEIWENVRQAFTPEAAYSFLVFNLLCAPCFAAIGAIRREMNSGKWTWFAIGYQSIFAYAVSLCIYQFGTLIRTGVFNMWTVLAALVLATFTYMLLKPQKKLER